MYRTNRYSIEQPDRRDEMTNCKTAADFWVDTTDSTLTWLTPPSEQGQTVSASYADLRDGRVLRRLTDRSDGSVSYSIADLDSDGPDEPSGLNGHPATEGWQVCRIA